MLVVVGVILGGVVLAAVFGAMREKGDSKSFWGNPKQAGVLIFALIVLAAIVLWMIDMNADSQF